MIQVTSTNVDRISDSFEKLSDILIDTIVKSAVHPFLGAVQRDGKAIHRHVRRTGTLERGIKVEKRKDGGQTFVDDTQVPYGKYVHMGQRSWAPDEFIFQNADRNERALDELIDKSIDEAFRKVRL